MSIPQTSAAVSARSAWPLYRTVLKHVEAHGIRYAVLRDRPSANPELKDLDLLVDPAQRKPCEGSLEEAGYLEIRGDTAPLKSVWIRYESAYLLTLDLHWAFVQDGLRYACASHALDRRRVEEGMFRLAPEDELAHLVIHTALSRRPPPQERVARIRELRAAPMDRAALERIAADACGIGLFGEALSWLGTPALSTRHHARIRRSFRRYLVTAEPGNAGRFLAAWLGRRLRRRRRGGLVALVGPDGVGKSTLIAAIENRGIALGGLRLAKVYLGPWGCLETPWLPWLRRIGVTPVLEPWGKRLRARLQGMRAVKTQSPEPSLFHLLGKWSRAEFKGIVFYAAVWLELWWRYAAHVVPLVRRGTWVLGDRYITDLRFLYKGNRMTNYAWLRRAATTLYPRPRLFVLLDQRAEVIQARKGGLSLEQIDGFRAAYRKALEGMPHVLLPTDLPPEILADRVLSMVIRLWAGHAAPTAHRPNGREPAPEISS
ncbi:MAG TPA: nucleotidyltransferase family protein [Candidatus Eisenbacteria bacterium]